MNYFEALMSFVLPLVIATALLLLIVGVARFLSRGNEKVEMRLILVVFVSIILVASFFIADTLF